MVALFSILTIVVKIHGYLHIFTSNPLVPVQNYSLPPRLLSLSTFPAFLNASDRRFYMQIFILHADFHLSLTSADLAIFYTFDVLKVFLKIFMALTKLTHSKISK